MNKRVAIYSILVIMISLLAIGFINKMEGKTMLTDSRLQSSGEVDFVNEEIKDEDIINEEEDNTLIENDAVENNEDNTVKEQLEIEYKKEEIANISIDRVLEIGTVGDDVKKVQDMLKSRGYYRGEIDGIYSEDFSMSVKKYQRDKGITETGNIGEKTLKTLLGSDEPDFTYVEFKRDIYLNMKGDDVKKVQYILKKRGYYKGEISGIYDKYTKDAVIRLQRDNNIRQTGNVGELTKKVLNN